MLVSIWDISLVTLLIVQLSVQTGERSCGLSTKPWVRWHARLLNKSTSRVYARCEDDVLITFETNSGNTGRPKLLTLASIRNFSASLVGMVKYSSNSYRPKLSMAAKTCQESLYSPSSVSDKRGTRSSWAQAPEIATGLACPAASWGGVSGRLGSPRLHAGRNLKWPYKLACWPAGGHYK